jgi:hypothetical protein
MSDLIKGHEIDTQITNTEVSLCDDEVCTLILG